VCLVTTRACDQVVMFLLVSSVCKKLLRQHKVCVCVSQRVCVRERHVCVCVCAVAVLQCRADVFADDGHLISWLCLISGCCCHLCSMALVSV